MVTIIIPYKNNLKYLFLALESIFFQTYKKYKIIIIYDNEDKKDLKNIKRFISKKKAINLLIFVKYTLQEEAWFLEE